MKDAAQPKTSIDKTPDENNQIDFSEKSQMSPTPSFISLMSWNLASLLSGFIALVLIGFGFANMNQFGAEKGHFTTPEIFFGTAFLFFVLYLVTTTLWISKKERYMFAAGAQSKLTLREKAWHVFHKKKEENEEAEKLRRAECEEMREEQHAREMAMDITDEQLRTLDKKSFLYGILIPVGLLAAIASVLVLLAPPLGEMTPIHIAFAIAFGVFCVAVPFLLFADTMRKWQHLRDIKEEQTGEKQHAYKRDTLFIVFDTLFDMAASLWIIVS